MFTISSTLFLLSFIGTAFFGIVSLIPANIAKIESIFLKKAKRVAKKRELGKIHAYTAPKFILEFDYEDYEKAASKINTPKSILEELIHGVYSLSTATDNRYDMLKYSYLFLLINIISFASTIVIYFFAKTL